LLCSPGCSRGEPQKKEDDAKNAPKKEGQQAKDLPQDKELPEQANKLKASVCFETLRKASQGLPAQEKPGPDHLWGTTDLSSGASESKRLLQIGRLQRLLKWQPEKAAMVFEQLHGNVRKLVADAGGQIQSDTGIHKDKANADKGILKYEIRKIKILEFEIKYRQEEKEGLERAQLWEILVGPRKPGPRLADFELVIETIEQDAEKK
jgi:hypothetical protein